MRLILRKKHFLCKPLLVLDFGFLLWYPFFRIPHLSTEMSRSSSAYSVKIAQICFALGFLGIVLFGLRSMMRGSNMNMALVVGAVIMFAVVFLLDARYWAFPAFCFGYYETMPYIRFTGAELGCLVLISTYFIRMAIHRDILSKGMKRPLLAAVPFMVWVCMVWAMNPTGLNMFGSTTIGGRFYFKILLSFFAMVCLSFLRFNEQDCKILICVVACGYLAFTIRTFLFGDTENQLMGTGTHYAFIHMSFVAPVFLCRFSAPELLSKGWPMLGFLVSFGLSFYSGNRTAAARPVVVGALAPFFLKRDRVKTVGMMVCSAFVLGVVVAGQGNVWRLPFAIQRPLSVLPGKWDRRLEDYGLNDTFRETLRMYAREHIRESPWVGDGGFAMDLQEVAWTNARNAYGDTFSGHVVARNWHNVWLGMAADFGIPLSVFWGCFMLVLMISGYKGAKTLPPGSWQQTSYLYFYLLILTEFLNFFFNGGHTSLTTQQLFVWAGLLMAVRNGVRDIASNPIHPELVSGHLPTGA